MYLTDLTVFTDGSFSYSDVSLSSSYEAAKAAYNKAVAAEGKASTALAQSVEYIVGTQTAVTGNWTGVSMDGALYAGKTIAYKLPYAGSGDASLTLTLADGSTTAAAPVYMNNTRVTTHYPQYTVIKMTYDGASWRTDNYYTNSDNYDRRLHNSAIKAAAAVTKAHLIAGTEAGYKNFAASLAFDLAYPILYASAAISANATAKTTYEAYPEVVFSTTGAIQSGAANKILWLKGTVTGNIFTIAEGNWLTTVVPVEDDGMYYIPLGVMSSTTTGYFASSDRLYAFVDDAFQPLDNASRKLAEKAREEVVDAEERVRTYTESAVSGHLLQASRTARRVLPRQMRRLLTQWIRLRRGFLTRRMRCLTTSMRPAPISVLIRMDSTLESRKMAMSRLTPSTSTTRRWAFCRTA